jgi:phosphoenolpyruvate carboxylase
LVAVRRFHGMGGADSRSLRSNNHVRMQHLFVKLLSYNDAVVCLHVPRAYVFTSSVLFAWWPPLLFLVRNTSLKHE